MHSQEVRVYLCWILFLSSVGALHKVPLTGIDETTLRSAIPSSLFRQRTLLQWVLHVYIFNWKLTYCAKTPLACVCLGLWRYVWFVPISEAALFTWEVSGSFGVNLSPRNATLGQENQQTGNELGHLHICLENTTWKCALASVCLIIFFNWKWNNCQHTGTVFSPENSESATTHIQSWTILIHFPKRW